MTSKSFSKGLKRSTLTVALGLCFAGGVSAQSSVGSIFGDTSANAAVTIENLDTGTSRQITSDTTGHFTFTQLSPGRYRVTSGGISREVQVKVGTGTQVALTASSGTATLDTVTVMGNTSINPIDVSSVESTTVFTQEQIQALPVSRDVTSVALLAPGTVKGDTGFGNLASFGGSSVAENGYYINGFDVTNIFNFLSYSDMPFDAIAEQQVKTGGYGAEYGRSLGGVVSLVTKRGTNEWKGGVSVYWNPESLREHSDNVLSRDPGATGSTRYSAYREDNTSDSLSYNIYGGGPLIKDRLFVFGLIEGKNNSYDNYGADTSQAGESDRPSGMVKLDWNITDNHLFELTAITNRDKWDYVNYENAAGQFFTGEHGAETSRYTTETGGEVYTAKYTGYFSDNFTLSAQAGQLKSLVGDRSPALLGSELCPRAFDSRVDPAATIKIGCWNEAVTFVRDQTQPPDQDKRDAFRLDGEWRLGDHQLRFGLDYEKFASQRAGVSYTGGIYYRYFKRSAPITIRGVLVPAGTDYVRTWDWRSTSGDFKITNQAAYLEDSWQATDNLLLYLGIRGEKFENKNADGIAFAESDTLWAPRLGFSWDVKGDATMKVFGNAGRYYIPVAGNTSVRMAGAEGYTENFYYYNGQIDPVTGAPAAGLGGAIGTTLPSGTPIAPDPRTVAATNLSPMYQDEYILGAQFEMPGNWMLGMRAISREVKSGMDDFCGHKPQQRWLEENGYDDAWFSYYNTGIPQCVLINPGEDVEIALNPYLDGNLIQADIPASYFGLPKFTRSYNAMEIFFERHKTDNWYLQGSYTFSKSKGTSEGYVNSTLEQTDAGITQDFDFKPFTDGTYGYLPNDRRHAIKLFGAYEITDEWQVGANLLIQSGRPLSCYGFIPLDDPSVDDSGLNTPVYDYYLAANWSGNSFYCKNPDGSSTLGSRGDHGRTPWMRSLDASVSYTPSWANEKLSIGLQVFNIFNNKSVTEYSEFSARGTNSAQEYDPNFMNTVNFQSPRSAQIVLRYQF